MPLNPPLINSETKPIENKAARREPNAGAPDGAQPVECLDGRGNGDQQRRDRENRSKERAHAADEHVMAPDDEAQSGDRHHRVNHHLVAENRLAAERRQDVGRDSHRGKDHDVDLRMAEEPEQVLPQQRMSTGVLDQFAAQHNAAGNEETRPAGSVEDQQNRGGKQHRECQQPSTAVISSDHCRQRQSHHRQALGSHRQDRRDVVQTAHQAGSREQRDRRNPQRHTRALVRVQLAAKRSVAHRPSSRPGARLPPPTAQRR